MTVQQLIYTSISILATITFILSLRTILKLTKTSKLARSVRLNFQFIAAGFLLFVAGEFSRQIISAIDTFPDIGVVDIFWMGGYVLQLAGFGRLLRDIHKEHPAHTGRGLAILISIGALIIIANIVTSFTPPATPFSITALNLAYPLVCYALIVVTLACYRHFTTIPIISSALALFSLSYFADLIGNILYAYYFIRDIYGPLGIASDLLFLSSYALASMAFYQLSMRKP